MQIESTWRGDGFIEGIVDGIEQNMQKAGFWGVSQLRRALNAGQPTTRRGGRLVGLEPSLPGQYPKKVSGKFQRSIAFTVTAGPVLTIGSTLDGYPSYLQKGTRRMRPRPWMTLFLAANDDALGRIILNGR